MSVMEPIWSPSPERIARRQARRASCTSARALRRAHVPDYDCALSLVDREPGEFWSALWGSATSRGRRGRRSSRSKTATACRARAGSRARGSTSPRTCCAGATTRPAIVFRNERGERRELAWRELRAASRRASPRRLRAAGVGAGRPRRRLPAEHARGRRRDARDGEPRRDLVVVLAGLRRRRACSTASARSSRRCCSPPTATSTPARRIDSLATIARGRCSSCRRVERVVVVPYLRASADARRLPQRRRCSPISRRSPRREHRASSGCRSIIRSTSCIRPARPACRSASCTAPAARCCST